MQIRAIRKGFEAFECKFEHFERDSKHSNANSKHSKGIRSIRMQIRTIRKGFEAFECKFEPFERDSKHSNANSNHSKGIRSIRMQIRNVRKCFKFEYKFKLFERDDSKGFEAFECKFEPFDRDSNHSNANSRHLKGIRSIRMQIRPIRKRFECKFEECIRKGFEAFEYKFEPFERDSKHSNANSNPFERDSKHSNANSNHSKGIRIIRIQI